MAKITLGGKEFDIDDDGFIQDPNAWDPSVADDLAKTEGVNNLTQSHWAVVNYIRDYYLKNNTAPMVRRLCKETNFKLSEIYEMFPSGPARGACKIAGLPKPTGCV